MIPPGLREYYPKLTREELSRKKAPEEARDAQVASSLGGDDGELYLMKRRRSSVNRYLFTSTVTDSCTSTSWSPVQLRLLGEVLLHQPEATRSAAGQCNMEEKKKKVSKPS
jgi:hypothetical protein